MGDALPAVSLGAGRTVVDVRAGFSHTCALLDSGALKCWGENDAGALGLGDTTDRGTLPAHMGDALPAISLGTGRAAVGFACGIDHTCAILDSGALKCWGSNNSGQLGLGDKVRRGTGATPMGDALPTVSW
jgi:alpha-tubulin suppressor-like RCC1 family protein